MLSKNIFIPFHSSSSTYSSLFKRKNAEKNDIKEIELLKKYKKNLVDEMMRHIIRLSFDRKDVQKNLVVVK